MTAPGGDHNGADRHRAEDQPPLETVTSFVAYSSQEEQRRWEQITMELDASNLVSGLIGAVVGGALAVAGSILANRREVIREARMHIFAELLPPLLEQSNYRSGSGLIKLVEALVRASPRTTRGDRDRIEALRALATDTANAALVAVKHQSMNDKTLKMQAPDDFEAPFQELGDRLLRQARALDSRLRSKIL